MVQLGGSLPNANTEIHDVRFTIGSAIEECYDDLRSQWWGDRKSLHLDCWGAIEYADGCDVTVTTQRESANALRLFFVHIGGYDPNQFGELHRNLLIVAADASLAKAKALRSVAGWAQPHRDKLFEVETAIDVGASAGRRGQFVRLTKANAVRPFEFLCRFTPIGTAAKKRLMPSRARARQDLGRA